MVNPRSASGLQGVMLCIVLGLLAAACTRASEVRARFPIIYADMDGTLLATIDGRREIPQATLDALACYKRSGGRWSIATGRSLEQVKGKFGGLQPNLPLVLFNGALRVDPVRTERLGPAPPHLEAAAVAAIEDVARNSKTSACAPAPSCVLGWVVHGMHHTVATPMPSPIEASNTRLAWDAFLVQGDLLSADRPLPADDPPIKMMIVTRDEAQGANDGVRNELKYQLEARLRNVGRGGYSVVTSNETVEVMAAGIDKAAAIELTLKETGTPWRDVIILGDSGNDVGMLEHGLGVVVRHVEKQPQCHPEACTAAAVQVAGPEALARFIRDFAVDGPCVGP